MISNKSPAKTANTIQGIGLKGFFVREPFGFAIIRALKPACGPQSAKNKGLASSYQCCSRLKRTHHRPTRARSNSFAMRFDCGLQP
jgi:hypothetical protein